jgi:hypothetical protein
MNSINMTARLAGLVYLIIAIFGILGVYIYSTLIVPGDATATVNHIMASKTLFRMGFVSDSIVFLSEIILVALLYILFKPVSKTLALVAAFSRLGMAVIEGVNLLNYVYALLLLSGASYLAVFQPAQLNALVMLYINAHVYGEYIWGLFFALSIFVLGYLIFKSTYFPKIVGIVLLSLFVFGALGYLIIGFGNFLLPDNGAISLISSVLIGLGSLGELLFAIWLLIKGVKVDNTEMKNQKMN